MASKARFGDLIRKLRKDSDLPLRKVASALDIDPSTLSKIERGERSASRDMAKTLATIFGIDESELVVSLLSDKIAFELINEDKCNEVLNAAQEKIKYFRSKSFKQQNLELR
jgi:transcriptional regulator with XRE-family HTH domain